MHYLNPDNFYRDDLDDREVMVSIRCIAFNQGKYIREALDGFVNQQAVFRFEAIVHDDASTDNTADIIREYAEKYPSIIKPIFETENQYSKRDGSLDHIMDSHMRGKYIAFCEGDDYWTDPEKLQKQFYFLESHPEYSLCCCTAGYYIEHEERLQKGNENVFGTFGIEFILIRNNIETCTVMLNQSIYNRYKSDFSDKMTQLSFGDYPLWLYMSVYGKCMKLPESMAVYRINSGGVSNLTDVNQKKDWLRSLIKVIDYFSINYIVDDEAISNSYYNIYRNWGHFAAIANEKDIYSRAVEYFKNNGYFWTAFLLKCSRHFPYLRVLWSFAFSHNRIQFKKKKSFDPK